MLDTMRKRQRSLLILITGITIVAFAWWYNPGHAGRGGVGQLGKVDGRPVTVEDVQKLERNLQLAGGIGLRELPELLASGRTREEGAISFAWNTFILRDEADRLQIHPSAEQITDAEKRLPEFQQDGQFDPSKYQAFVDKTLKPNGLTAADLDEVVADDLRLRGILDLIKGGAQVPEAMLRENYEKAHAKMHLAVVRLPRADFEKAIQVSDQDIKKYYDEHRDQLKSPEQRRVEMAAFTLNSDQKKLDESKKNEVLKALAKQAETFVQPVLDHPGQFEQIAKDQNVKIQETGLYNATNPDPLLKTDPTLSRQADALSSESPVSDVVQTADGFYVLKLKDVVPSKPLTLDQAKGQIASILKNQRIQTAMETKAKELRAKILADLKTGKTFADAVAASGHKAEEPPPFSFQDAGQINQLLLTLYYNQVDLEPGQVSKLLTENGDGLLVYLEKRDPIDQNAYQADEKKMLPEANNQFADMLFAEWLKVQQQRVGRPPV